MIIVYIVCVISIVCAMVIPYSIDKVDKKYVIYLELALLLCVVALSGCLLYLVKAI